MQTQPAPVTETDGNAQPTERLLSTAKLLFCRDGIHATGIDRIIAESGVARMTLYNRFGSKEGLLYAVLEREGEEWRDWFFAAVEAAGNTPAQKLKAVFPVLRSWFEREDYFGCAFINAVAEHDKGESKLRGLTLQHKGAVLEFFGRLARDAGINAPDALAHQIGLLMDGAIVAAMVTRQPAMADHAATAAGAILDAALPKAA
ncbi:MAG: TetR/AcrR family transcriptional regulator [Ferrovibrio sp.]|uniref:TetR/AcrR family transcriptional regulator n=1 Tax=Ferrovibrio sp. TaxID=1917215 RepID=UPI003919BE6B